MAFAQTLIERAVQDSLLNSGIGRCARQLRRPHSTSPDIKMLASKHITMGFFLCFAMAVGAEPRYALRDRTIMEVSHATVPNMHKWSAANCGTLYPITHASGSRQTDDDYDIYSHAVHELCGKNGGKYGGKYGGKNGGKNGKYGGRRKLHKGGKGCYDDDITAADEDDGLFQQDDDVDIPPSPSFAPLTGDDSPDDDVGIPPSPSFVPLTGDDSPDDDVGIPLSPSFVPLTGDDSPDDDVGIPPSPSFVPLTGDDPPVAPPTPPRSPAPTPTASTSVPTVAPVQGSAAPSIQIVTSAPTGTLITPTTAAPTPDPTQAPTPGPNPEPTTVPTPKPTLSPTDVPTNAPTGAPIDRTRAPSGAPIDPTLSNDDITTLDDDNEVQELDDDQVGEVPSNNSVDVLANDDSTDDTAGDDSPTDDDDSDQQSISNEGTSRQGTGGGFIPGIMNPPVDPEEPVDEHDEITNEDFVAPTNED
eukprot:scaffold3028_cov174-Amphora_coffeaeformis.AAC.7